MMSKFREGGFAKIWTLLIRVTTKIQTKGKVGVQKCSKNSDIVCGRSLSCWFWSMGGRYLIQHKYYLLVDIVVVKK